MKNIAISKTVLILASICAVCFPSLVFAKKFQDKTKGAIENASKYLQDKVDATAEGMAKAQEYFDHYPWKGIIQERVSCGAITLSDLKMNGDHRVAVLYPGQWIEGRIRCALDPNKCSTFAGYQIMLGFPGIGPQTSFSKRFAGETDETFNLMAPEDPGVYELRFRVVEQMTEFGLFEHWRDERGAEPGASTTIGVVIVK